jgi:adenylate cyclase
LTTGEETTIRLFTGVSRDLLGERSTLRAARVTGAAMARIAATLVEGFRLQIEMPRRDSGVPHPEVVEMYSELTSTVLPAFIESLDAVLRCQILTAGKQMWSTDVDRSAMTVERTVGFVDLVGYTALVETLSVGQLAELLSDFDETTSEVVSRWNGTIVKSIGDELMFVTQDPNDACRIAVELIERFGSDGHLPVRVGLATGEMVSVLGDLFGANVNLAARLVAVAEPGTTVVSELTGDSVSGYDLGALPPLTLKGIPHPVVAHVLR